MKRFDLKLRDRGPCDITLVVENGKEFNAHRHVLSEASSFFERLFNSNMKESREEVVRLEMITESQMSDVLKFIYTGTIKTLTHEKAEDLLAVADYLLLEGLKNTPQKFLKKNLSTSNCISHYYLAEKYMGEDLLVSCRKFIHENFATVAESPEFMNLSSHEVEKWISSDEIIINEEEDVFKIVLKWIDQDKSQRGVKFPVLFRHVRLTSVTRDFLVRNVMKKDLVKENKECCDRVTEALTWLNRRRTKCRSPRPDPPRKALGSCAIVACGLQKPFDCFCYLPENNEWYRLPRAKGRAHYVVSYRGQLFIIYEDNINKSQCYDSDMNHWSPAPWAMMGESKLDQMVTSGKWFQAVLVVGNEICFIVQNSMERSELWKYNLETNSVSPPIPWEEGRHTDPTVIAIDKDIYTIGGLKDVESNSRPMTAVSDAARYNTVENKWGKIAPIQVGRYEACGLGTNEKIFIAGGISDNGKKIQRLRSCEVYDISTDEWQFMSDLKFARFHSNMVSANGTLYVLGGSVYDDFIDSFPITCVGECYYPKKTEWSETIVIPVDKMAVHNSDPQYRQQSFIFNATTMTIFKKSLHKLKSVGDSGIQMG